MIFLELVLQNFGPYQGRQVLNLRPDQDPELRPIILLGGMNGGGKTTLMDAIRLALYGPRAQCSTRGNLSYSDFLNQCVNSHASTFEKTRIELVFEHLKDEKLTEFRIVRTWENNLKDNKDTLGILIKDEDLNEDWKDDSLTAIWDEYIENLLPLGISNLFLFDGEQVKELADLEKPPDAVIKSISSLLGLELAERLGIDLDILQSRKRKELASDKQLEELEVIEQKLSQQQQEERKAKEKLEGLEKQLKKADKKQKQAAEKYISEGGKIAQESKQLEKQVEQLEENVKLQRDSLGQLAEGVLPLGLITPLLNTAKTQLETDLNRKQSSAAREVLKERDRRLLSYIKDLSLSNKNIDQIQSFLEQEDQVLAKTIDSGVTVFEEANSEVLNQLKNTLDHQLPEQINQANSYINKIQEIETEIDTIEVKLKTAAPEELQKQLESNLKQAQAEFLKTQTETEHAQGNLDKLSREIAKTQKELESYSQKSLKYKNSEHIVNSIDKVQETLKLFKEKLTLRKLNKLEGEVTECFRYLLHKSDLVHRVTIDTHNFSLSLYDPQGKPLPKHRLSAGEKQLLAIAFLWGLARVSGRNLPVAIDTPLGRLDSSHRHNLVERYFPAASHQVILLSTDTEIDQTQVKQLREMNAISQEYLLKYDPKQRQTTVEKGYFW
ncbi:MAG: DNA sulfur modification protein DndD [Microcoleaceae cyanobacterium]